MKGFGITKNIPMLREARTKRGHVFIVELLIFILVFIVGSIIEAIPVGVGMFSWLFGQTNILSLAMNAASSGDVEAYVQGIAEIMEQFPAWLMLLFLFSTVLLTLTAILFCRWIEKRRTPSMGLRRKNAVGEYAVGALMGIGLVVLTVTVSVFTGGVESVSFRSVNWLLFVLYLLGFMVQGMSEEVLCRGYFMVSVTRRNPVWLALILSSAVFSLLHFANPGYGWMPALNIFLTGLVFGTYALKRGNLWGACAMHSFWNFCVGNVFGISVSGSTPLEGSHLLETAVASGNELWTGGEFGLEGSLCITIVMLVALALELFVMPPANDGRFDESVPAVA